MGTTPGASQLCDMQFKKKLPKLKANSSPPLPTARLPASHREADLWQILQEEAKHGSHGNGRAATSGHHTAHHIGPSHRAVLPVIGTPLLLKRPSVRVSGTSTTAAPVTEAGTPRCQSI
ncbi:UNVERIFIED_CONTAM: hypothetical protein K2H54_012316 [Gekko kuhli]